GSTAPPPSAEVEAALEPETPMDDRRHVPRPPPAQSRPTARVGQGPADVALPQVRLRVESRPTGATASAAGARCRTPCELRVPRSTEPVALRVERPGRVPVERSVVPDVDREVAVRLARRRPPRVEEERDPSPDFYPFE
ncbi:MAG: PEGA domain-containing protein, partial [Sandaracinaceae bacterium]